MFVERLATSAPAASIREGFIAAFPYLVLANVFELLLEFLTMFLDNSLVGIKWFDYAIRILFALVPHVVIAAMAMALARHYYAHRTSAVIVVLIAYWLFSDVAFQNLYYDNVNKYSFWTFWLLPSVVIAFPLFLKLCSLRWMYLPRTRSLSPLLQEGFNIILPLAATVGCLILLKIVFDSVQPVFVQFVEPALSIVHSWPYLLKLLLYVLLVHSMWFFGIHGYNVSLGLLTDLQTHAGANGLASPDFLELYVYVGGAGGTLSLVAVMLLCARGKRHRSLAKISAPLGVFNINETILFGLPIVFNPRLIIPFIVLPMLTTLLSYTALSGGLVPLSQDLTSISWLVPPLVNAYLLTEGSIAAIGLQLLCFLLGMLFYYPFYKSYESGRPRSDAVGDILSSLHVGNEYTRHGVVVGEANAGYEIAYDDSNEESYYDGRLAEWLRKGKFVLFYQPKLEARTKKVTGFEALLRYQDESGHYHLPTFLPAVQRMGLNTALDRWVLSTACEQLKRWAQQGVRMKLSINVSTAFFSDVGLLNVIKSSAVDASTLQLLELEIVEQDTITNFEHASKVIDELRRWGVTISIDDFGTGYSSLSYIAELEIDAIKIDRSFTEKIMTSRGETVIREIINLAHQLGIEVVVEGVENERQHHIALQLGADVLQGYWIGGPMHASEVKRFFN